MTYKRNRNKIYNKMKIAFITLTILLLSENMYSQRIRPERYEPEPIEPDFPIGPIGPVKPRPCQRKSGDPETDTDCCMKPLKPSWCPNISESAIKKDLSTFNKSSEARSFAKKEVASFSEKRASSNSLAPSAGIGQSQALTFRNFWWPWFCRWNSWCCIRCYIRWIIFGRRNWWRYWWCIWRGCRRFRFNDGYFNKADSLREYAL